MPTLNERIGIGIATLAVAAAGMYGGFRANSEWFPVAMEDPETGEPMHAHVRFDRYFTRSLDEVDVRLFDIPQATYDSLADKVYMQLHPDDHNLVGKRPVRVQSFSVDSENAKHKFEELKNNYRTQAQEPMRRLRD